MTVTFKTNDPVVCDGCDQETSEGEGWRVHGRLHILCRACSKILSDAAKDAERDCSGKDKND